MTGGGWESKRKKRMMSVEPEKNKATKKHEGRRKEERNGGTRETGIRNNEKTRKKEHIKGRKIRGVVDL